MLTTTARPSTQKALVQPSPSSLQGVPMSLNQSPHTTKRHSVPAAKSPPCQSLTLTTTSNTISYQEHQLNTSCHSNETITLPFILSVTSTQHQTQPNTNPYTPRTLPYCTGRPSVLIRRYEHNNDIASIMLHFPTHTV